jgi:superfamily I DNA/RNA helicase
MRARLEKLIGYEKVHMVKMGTFHALCAAFLRRYADFAGLEANFTICDVEERCFFATFCYTYVNWNVARRLSRRC